MKRERRKFTNEFKAEVALEAIKEKLTMVELAMKYKVNPIQICVYKKVLENFYFCIIPNRYLIIFFKFRLKTHG